MKEDTPKMQDNFSAAFVKATETIFMTMLGMPTDVLGNGMKIDRGTLGSVSGIIGLAGENAEGLLVVSFAKETICAIASSFYGEEYLEINQEALDSAGELTNMICGGAKAILSEQGIEINMASPTVVQGENISVSFNRETDIFITELSLPAGRFYLEVGITLKP